MTEKNDKHFYLIANEEWVEDIIDVALWAKCMTINEGDKKKSKYDYLRMRVESLINEEREKVQKKEKEDLLKQKEIQRKKEEARRRRRKAEIKQKEALLKQKAARKKEQEVQKREEARKKREEARKKYLKQVQSEIGTARMDTKLRAEAVETNLATGHETIVSFYIEKRISMLMNE